MNEQNTTDPLEEFRARCRRRGVRVTPQRVAVFQELSETDEHPPAKTIYERVRRHMPSISLDTVYRTLSVLQSKGLISNVSTADNPARYDARTGPHYHFVCERCHRVIDVFPHTMEPFDPPEHAGEYGEIEKVRIQLHGVCNACLEKEPGEAG